MGGSCSKRKRRPALKKKTLRGESKVRRVAQLQKGRHGDENLR